MEEKVEQFIDKVGIVRRWYAKVAIGVDDPVSDEDIVILLDTLGVI